MSGRTCQSRLDFFAVQPSASFLVMRVNAISGASRNVYKKRRVVFVKTDQVADLSNFNHFLCGMPQRAATQTFHKVFEETRERTNGVIAGMSGGRGPVCSCSF